MGAYLSPKVKAGWACDWPSFARMGDQTAIPRTNARVTRCEGPPAAAAGVGRADLGSAGRRADFGTPRQNLVPVRGLTQTWRPLPSHNK